ncbi:MAG: biotin/lipoyl-binding protein [Ignavibacteriae bacterium]|nr:biotin/lipoyl-binding protein [Ignavibacteriota bacterium]
MKNFFINPDGTEKQIEAVIKDNKTALINDTKVEYEHKFISDNVMILRINNKNYIVKAENDSEEEMKDTSFEIDIKSEVTRLLCKSELDVLMEKFSKNRGDVKIKTDIVSPMPGAIVKINVTEGQKVKKGEVFLVLEAMKMENELKAASDCVIQKIFAEEKKSVEKGQILLKLEPSAAE